MRGWLDGFGLSEALREWSVPTSPPCYNLISDPPAPPMHPLWCTLPSYGCCCASTVRELVHLSALHWMEPPCILTVHHALLYWVSQKTRYDVKHGWYVAACASSGGCLWFIFAPHPFSATDLGNWSNYSFYNQFSSLFRPIDSIVGPLDLQKKL